MKTRPAVVADRRLPVAIVLLAIVFACLGTANLGGPAPVPPAAAAQR